jgi:phage tail-like protein
MDVNNTKFHLLLTETDWGNSKIGRKNESLSSLWKRQNDGDASANPPFEWKKATNEIALSRLLVKFEASKNDRKPNLDDRRGAARDRYGNWYWIDENGSKIKVLSVGSNRVSDFYSSATICKQTTSGDFKSAEEEKSVPMEFRGLAVTIDHYLIVGTVQPAGLLVFDLFAGGEPRQILWRNDVEFVPFDMSARTSGGVFILDRKNSRYWTLSRNFQLVCVKDIDLQETSDDFQPTDNSENRKHTENLSADKFYSKVNLENPVSIETLPDDTVLILNRPPNEEFSKIYRFYRDVLLDVLETKSIADHVKPSKTEKFTLLGYDIAFVSGAETNVTDTLFIVSESGNQAFAFDFICKDDLILSPAAELPSNVIKKHFKLKFSTDYYPMRLFGGKGFTTAEGKVYYDLGERWLPLVKQNRPSFIENAELTTQIFDGKETNCVWHRLLIDGCIPKDTSIEVYSRTAEKKTLLDKSSWNREPNLYLRGNGSELPFVVSNTSKNDGKGTWELLLQQSKGRFLQLRLVFTGNRQRTPKLSALRVYYPRFSYLDHYLPSIYREDEQSASFLYRFLANIEGFYTNIEDKIAAVQILLDFRSSPPEALDWLAGWFGIALDPKWTDDKRRLFIKHAIDFFQTRGTLKGLRTSLRLVLDDEADEKIFLPQTKAEQKLDPIRIVERFRTRITPELIPADRTVINAPRTVQTTAKWNPNLGADDLHRRYSQKLADGTEHIFPLIKPVTAEESTFWEQFAAETLGFVPSSAASGEIRRWQSFLADKYANNINSFNVVYNTDFDAFNEISLPNNNDSEDWKNFTAATPNVSRNRKLWQDFLARRYRKIGELNIQYQTNWSSFEFVSLFDKLPNLNTPLADWFQFESIVLAMHTTAHRFTVLIPASFNGNNPLSAEEQKRKLQLVRQIIELEKPAHTVCDFRFYWNLFRVDEVRLGFDTLLGLGSRDPLLNPAFEIGQAFIGESRLALEQPEKYENRYVLGSEDLKQM